MHLDCLFVEQLDNLVVAVVVEKLDCLVVVAGVEQFKDCLIVTAVKQLHCLGVAPVVEQLDCLVLAVDEVDELEADHHFVRVHYNLRFSIISITFIKAKLCRELEVLPHNYTGTSGISNHS